jgi:DNA-directed RNA polymerase subunit RPC12/RpoP
VPEDEKYVESEEEYQNFWDIANHCQSSGEGHSCSTCGKSYRWMRTLYRHMQFECGRQPHLQCPYCPHRTMRNWNLQKHMQLKHTQLIL